jgi:flavin reductase
VTETHQSARRMTLSDHESSPLRTGFIEAMSRTASTVGIVTTDGEAGRLGLTVSSICSVTADPPTLLVCINKRSPIGDAIRQNVCFAVSCLRADQRNVAESFAGRPRRGSPYDFSSSQWTTGRTGSPLLIGAIAQFDCRLQDLHEVGTHTILVGLVEEARDTHGTPLVYGRRGFGEMMRLPDARGTISLFPDPVWDEQPFEEIYE